MVETLSQSSFVSSIYIVTWSYGMQGSGRGKNGVEQGRDSRKSECQLGQEEHMDTSPAFSELFHELGQVTMQLHISTASMKWAEGMWQVINRKLGCIKIIHIVQVLIPIFKRDNHVYFTGQCTKIRFYTCHYVHI